MAEASPHGAVPSEACEAGVSPALEALIEEVRDMPFGALFALVARQLARLGPEVQAEVRPLGVLFRDRGTTLCELSLYGELFLARMGPGLAVEVRVRNSELALVVLDQVLRHSLRTPPTAPPLPG